MLQRHTRPIAGALVGLSLVAALPALAQPAPPVSPAPVVNYEYDALGNRKKITQAQGVAGFGFATQAGYDSLNRLASITDARSKSTTLGYNGRQDITSVTDARLLLTQYPRNGLGDATSLVSPDTGTATHTYDAAGNLKTRTDSRGVLATYTYDALNRATGVVYSKSGQPNLSQSWNYDQTGPLYANGIGRLTSTSHPTGLSRYTYDPQGRLASVRQVVNATSGANSSLVGSNIDYTYDAAGNLTSIVYPSGRKLTLSYTNSQLSSMALARNSSSTPTTLISSIQFDPFGAPRSWLWQLTSTTQLHERILDTYGRVVRLRLGPHLRDITYDAADRITGYTHYDAVSGAAVPSLNQGFGYDELARLTGITTASSSWSIGYDDNGNRTSVTLNGTSSVYTTASTSNRLSAITNPARSLGYDNAGNTTSGNTGGAYTATYDLAGRLATLSKAGVSTTYTVDAEGRRVRKFSSTGAASTVVYAYDASGHLLGEYDSTGKELREYVWLGDTPIAVFTPDPTGPSLKPPLVYYVHTDHIAAPRIVLDKANNIRWRWLAEPFGSTAAEENPSALGALQVALRLPGQLFDAESSLHYNYFRDYDPSVGRYLQSDPIGLAGGINTYAYVGGNPVSYVDPTGEYGLPGFLAGGAFNLGFQFFSNLYLSDGDWKLAARCIDFTDVLVSAGIGALGPGAWGQVIRGKPGPLGLTRGQDTYVYLTRSLPAGFFLKQGLPSLRVADDCECKDLKLTGAISKFLH